MKPSAVSLHPLTWIRNDIKSDNVRAAFDKVIGDKRTPNSMSLREVNAFLTSAIDNERAVPGHDLTAAELADLQMIANRGGSYLFGTDQVSKAYTRRLATYEKKPTVSIAETDPGIEAKSVAVNKIAIKGRANGDLCPSGVVCIIGGPTTVTIDVAGQKFAVRPNHDESAQSVARRLEKQLDDAGFKASVATQGGRAILSVNGKASLPLASLTTDRAVSMQVAGNTVSIGVGIGGPINFSGGKIGLKLKGQEFIEQTKKGDDVFDAFDRLRKQIVAAGFDVEVSSPPAIDTFMQAWTITASGRANFEAGKYAELKGKLGPADAEGARYLTLEKSIQVGESIADTIKVPGGDRWKEGQVTLNGRLDLVQTMLMIHPPTFEVQMTGVTNTSGGEPRFDGQNFFNSKGAQLERLDNHRPNMWDGPSVVIAVDHAADRAFFGSIASGFRRPDMENFNPFGGFNDSRELRQPTRQDIGELEFKAPNDTNARAREQWPFSRATGEALAQIGGPDTVQGKRWFIDHATDKIYGINVESATDRTIEHVIAPEVR